MVCVLGINVYQFFKLVVTGEMMEIDIRTALMIISAIAIFAILLHGLWKIRKNKNPYKLKAKVKDLAEQHRAAREFDRSGFDQDGVGQIRVAGVSALTGEIEHPPQEHEIPHQPAPAPEFHEEPLPKDLLEKEQLLAQEPEILATETVQFDDINLPPIVLKEEELVPEMLTSAMEQEGETSIMAEAKTAVTSENRTEIKVEKPALYAAPVSNPKPEAKKFTARTRRKTSSRENNQMGFNFGEESQAKKDLKNTAENSTEKPKAVNIEQEVIVLSVLMPENQLITGAALLPTLLTLGMKFGEMNIFHRHQDNAGNGKVTFSLANMMNPGTFDLDTMETFTTQGVSLFMTLPNPGDAFTVFEQMLAAAKQIAKEFNGQLLDDKRSVMTKQTEQHYIGRIREFERKYRIAVS